MTDVAKVVLSVVSRVVSLIHSLLNWKRLLPELLTCISRIQPNVAYTIFTRYRFHTEQQYSKSRRTTLRYSFIPTKLFVSILYCEWLCGQMVAV